MPLIGDRKKWTKNYFQWMVPALWCCYHNVNVQTSEYFSQLEQWCTVSSSLRSHKKTWCSSFIVWFLCFFPPLPGVNKPLKASIYVNAQSQWKRAETKGKLSCLLWLSVNELYVCKIWNTSDIPPVVWIVIFKTQIHLSETDTGFPPGRAGGANPKSEARTYYFDQVSQKLHENKKKELYIRDSDYTA